MFTKRKSTAVDGKGTKVVRTEEESTCTASPQEESDEEEEDDEGSPAIAASAAAAIDGHTNAEEDEQQSDKDDDEDEDNAEEGEGDDDDDDDDDDEEEEDKTIEPVAAVVVAPDDDDDDVDDAHDDNLEEVKDSGSEDENDDDKADDNVEEEKDDDEEGDDGAHENSHLHEHQIDLDSNNDDDEETDFQVSDALVNNNNEGMASEDFTGSQGHAVSSRSAAGAEAKKVRKQQRKMKHKRPKDMPTRPLSAYNYFFREERIKWLETKPEVLDKSKVWEPEPDGRKIKSRLFESMAKEIARRWKELPSDLRQKYIDEANGDMNRYRAEMELFQQRKVLERGGRKVKKSDKLGTKTGRIIKQEYDESGKVIPATGYSSTLQPLSSSLTAAAAKYKGVSNVSSSPGEKRGRGRPPGAKNKKTLAAEAASLVGGYVQSPSRPSIHVRKQQLSPTLPSPKPGDVPTQGGSTMSMQSAATMRAKPMGRSNALPNHGNFNFTTDNKNDLIGGPVIDPMAGNAVKKGKKQMLNHMGSMQQSQMSSQYGGMGHNRPGGSSAMNRSVNMRGHMGAMNDDLGYGNFRGHDGLNPVGGGIDGNMIPMGRNQMNDPTVMRKPSQQSNNMNLNPIPQSIDFANLTDDQLRALLEQQNGSGSRGFDPLSGRSPNSAGMSGSFSGSGNSSSMDMMNRQLQSQQYKLQMMQNNVPIDQNVRGMGNSVNFGGGGGGGGGLDQSYGMSPQGYGPSGGYSGGRGGGDSLSMQGMNSGFPDISERGPMTGRRPSTGMMGGGMDDNMGSGGGSGNNYQILQLLAAQQGGSGSGTSVGGGSGSVSGNAGGYGGYNDFHTGY